MRTRTVVFIALLLALVASPAAARQTDPAVRGVLFFSPTCPHCEYVIQEVLPPLFDEHGGPWELVYDESLPESEIVYYLLTNGTLEVLLVDVTVEAGAEFFQATTDALAIGSSGVPQLIVSNQVMIGSNGIPERFPGLIDDGLAGDGIDWPDLPGLADVLADLPAAIPTTTVTTAPPTSTSITTPTSTVPASTTTTAPATAATLPGGDGGARSFGDDAVGNSVAVIVLLGLVAGLGTSAAMVRRRDLAYRPLGLVPLLVLAGMVIAGYLTYVEVGGADAVCGPVGDCNVVQQSEYASVAGIPIGLIGLVGYLGIGGLWLVARRAPQRRADLARLGMALVTVGGAAFTAWLTFLEPFVIHATCAWCIGSALVIGALMWLTVPGGIAAWRRVAPISDVE